MTIHTPGVTTAAWNQLITRLNPLTVTMAPTNGQTVQLPNTDQEIILNLTPAAPLASVNVVLPSNDSSRPGQRVFIATTRQIDNITASGTTVVNNASVMMSPGDNIVFIKNDTNTWSRVIG